MESVSEYGLSSVSKSSVTSLKTRFYVPWNNGVCLRKWPQFSEQIQQTSLKTWFHVHLKKGICLRMWLQFSEQTSITSLQTRFYVPINNGVCHRMWPQNPAKPVLKLDYATLNNGKVCLRMLPQFSEQIQQTSLKTRFYVPLNTGVCLRMWPLFSEQIQQNQF